MKEEFGKVIVLVDNKILFEKEDDLLKWSVIDRVEIPRKPKFQTEIVFKDGLFQQDLKFIATPVRARVRIVDKFGMITLALFCYEYVEPTLKKIKKDTEKFQEDFRIINLR